jgi:hypothetical protein
MAAADVVGTGQEDTAVDEASVLAQIRRFLMCPSEREAAGTLLWDLSAGANLANTMVHAGKVGCNLQIGLLGSLPAVFCYFIPHLSA